MIIFTKCPYQGNEDILVKRNAVHIPSGLLLPPYNARICGWLEAQRKTSPATCACYVLLNMILLLIL